MSCLYSSPECCLGLPNLITEPELPRLDAARLSSAPNHDAVQNRTDVANHRVQQMTRPQPPALIASGPNHSPCRNKPDRLLPILHKASVA
jgi:hypothetical protein